MLKTLLRNIVHFPTLRMDFYFLVEKGIFLQFLGKNKTYSVTELVCKWKGRVYFSEKSNYTGKAEILLMCRLVEQWICVL